MCKYIKKRKMMKYMLLISMKKINNLINKWRFYKKKIKNKKKKYRIYKHSWGIESALLKHNARN